MRHPIIRREARTYSFAGIVAPIEAAKAAGLKRVSMRFSDFIVKPSKHGGRAYIYSHEKAENQWGTYSNVYLGWVTDTATNLPAELAATVATTAANPAAAAKLYGQQTGRCSCCGRELTDPASIAAGIGPICADKFGL
jgi:hypothetical protein